MKNNNFSICKDLEGPKIIVKRTEPEQKGNQKLNNEEKEK